jgi:hypothetical protein
MMIYFINIATALSQLLNAVVFAGDPNETVSGRVYREDRKWAVKIIDLLFFFQPDHCLESHVADRMFSRKILGEYDNDTI